MSKSAATLKSINGWLVVFWLANIPPVVVLYLTVGPDTFVRVTMLYVALISIWANVAAHFGAWETGRVEVRQEEQNGSTSPGRAN